MTGSSEPSTPRVTQRSYNEKSSNPSNGPGPNVPRVREAESAWPAGVNAGICPFGGSMIIDV